VNAGLVSVGIPTYNRPVELRRCLSFITGQTYGNLEIIVSDNASPGEETRRVVEEMMARDSRIRYVRQPSNLGPVANFQTVLDAASGEYFMWASDDDWRDERFIESLLNVMLRDQKVVLAFCDIAVLDRHGNRHADFPDTYLPFLKRLPSPMRFLRLTRYFLQDEALGKANLIYGLLRKKALEGISPVEICRRFGFHGSDNLIVFAVLGRGDLALADGKLYGCTAGNEKHYLTIDKSAFRRRVRNAFDQLRYLSAYFGLADGALKFVIAALLPLKLALSYWHGLRRKFARND
jgi:glycosyltransferase involved in cell wall biosynthesis